MRNIFGGFGGELLKVAAVAAITTVAGSSARAAVTYSTSFESPAYVAGTTVVGTDGWLAGSTTGTSQTVSSARASDGTQSLFFDNTGANNSFYSVEHALGTFTGTILTLSVNVYLPAANGVDRSAEVEFSTGTLGSGVLGISIDGAGDIRYGKTWSNLYSTTVIAATAPAGTYSDRWLTATLTLNATTGAGTVTLSGFGGATPSYSSSFTGVTTPTNVNLGTDYINTTARAGSVYFDAFSISTSAVPEPSTVTAALLGAGMLRLLIRRRSVRRDG